MAMWVALAIALPACSPTEPSGANERVGEAELAAFSNGDFESGTANQVPPSPWILTTYLNPNPGGVTIQTPQTRAGLNLVAVGPACSSNSDCVNSKYGTCQSGFCKASAKTLTLSGSSQPDATLGSGASLRWPRYGSKCALVNQLGDLSNANSLSQTMTITSSDVDPTDGNVHVRFAVAPVLEDPSHPSNQQPYFYIQLTNITQSNAVLYSNFNFANQSGVPWQTLTTTGSGATTYRYTDWQLVDISPGSPALNMGDQVQLELIASGCSIGGHMGELYVDGLGASVPGLYVSGTGPAQANAGTDITYTVTYKNGSASTACTTSANCSPNTEACVGGFCAETNTVVDFTTPPNTTFKSMTSLTGATCTKPSVGSAGTVVCTFTNPVGPGATGSFTVTVNITTGTTGQLVCGTYDIHSTQETTLLGNKITTTVGCTQDSDCASGYWCNETASACTATLANGVGIPSDPPHTSPTLNGSCTTAAATLVCTSKACDTTDKKCGYLNGDGPCTAANGGTVCRSAVCDPDLKCGYAVGDGPCTSANAGTVCRSGACSVSGFCEPAGGCLVDGDCTGGNWCNESSHTCTPKLANGTAIPTDAPHTSPTLNGTCTTAAATLVCTSGACDTNDNKCGIATGDGTCTVANGATVCRSGACSVNGLCQPAGGCNVDGDCTGGNWCNETTHTCTPKLSNGTAIPTDAPHTSPTLNGTCSTAAGTLVCTSGVCDTNDNKCGFATGDGTCTVANGATTCRSGACSVNGLCEPAGGCNVDGDCTGGKWCNETTHVCTAKLSNGTAMPADAPHASPTLDGTCSTAAGTLVCASGVCDTNDNKCGLATGDGSCTVANGATVCRSGACSVNGLCEPAGGCNVDGDCTGGAWCNETLHVCTAKISNGTAMPTDAPHVSPTLDGTCTSAAAALVCASGACDSDNKCGLVNGDGPCNSTNGGTVCRSGVCDPDLKCGFAVGDGPCLPSTAAVVCRSGTCSVSGFCEPLGGCNVDGDCTGGTWCDETAHACMPKLANGVAMPTDAPHTSPTLDGTCSTAAALLVCASGVCDPTDNKCGLATGDGTCTVANGPTVCRSGACSVNTLCEPAGGCNVDGDCTGGTWCNGTTHTCSPTLDNGTPMPTDAKHASPTLDGTCTTAAGLLVCTSGVCDTNDNACGYASGDGPCTTANAGMVCRSASCSANGLCEPAGGCNVDADCDDSLHYCDETAHVCKPKLPNGTALPKDPAHTSPTLDGTCSTAAGALVCLSGVCDTKDNACGYADGDGSCSKGNAGVVCRSASCSANGVCAPAGGCNVDADCAAGKWCNVTMNACVPTLANGVAVPTDAPHKSPSLDGTCTKAAGALVCTSGVCDAKDNECGYANGDGPCTGADGASVCRSTFCATSGPNQGNCVACLGDAQCSAPTAVCNTTTNACVQCVTSASCSGATPVCNTTTSTCVACNGDYGSAATNPCGDASAPLCFTSGSMAGQCGKCSADADCKSHAGTVCDTTSGLCAQGCHVDADCASTDWCNASDGAVGMCVPKIDNGKPLPSAPSIVTVCDADVGKRVCKSGVCDNDSACGFEPGDGPCTNASQCRNDVACNATTMTCTSGCKADSDCESGEFCKSDGKCTPKLPDGATCSGSNECNSGACDSHKCDGLIASGNGLICAARPAGAADAGGGAAALGLLFAAAGFLRRRRR